MAASFPGALATFTTLVDGVDEVLAAHQNAPNDEIVAIETALGTNPQGSATDLKTRLSLVLNSAGLLNFNAASTLTISGGSITTTQNWHRVDTEGAATSDNLDTITATADGYLLILHTVADGRDVVIRNGVGNIITASAQNITLGLAADLAILIYDATLTKWLAFSVTQAGLLNAANTWTGNQTFTAGVAWHYRTITATDTLTVADMNIFADASSGAITVNLPGAASVPGQVFCIWKTDVSANTVTLDADGAETINGAATQVISTQYTSLEIISTGGAWLIR